MPPLPARITRGGVVLRRIGAFPGSPFHIFGPATSRNILSAGHMAIAAVGFDEFVTDIHRMYEIIHLGPRRNVFLLLADDGMAEVTILGNDPPVTALMFPVVAAEAAGRIEVAYVIGIGIPGDLHVG